MRPIPVEKALQRALRERFEGLADPKTAAGAQAYMKSAMPYHGIKTDPMRKVCKEVFAAHPLPDEATWESAVLTLWREAKRREERYAAIELTGMRAYKAFQGLARLPMYEEMIVDGAWWDYVDAIAIHRLGPILLAEPKVMKKTMLAWSRDAASMWKRRSAIICQVAAKTKTDLDLLYRAIEPNLADKEFFIRKGIGWALRAYAWVDPEEISRYVAENADRLSGLSKREALKNVK